METQTMRSTHPLLIVAAAAVTLFSLVGIAAVMGWIPTSNSGSTPPIAQVTPPPVPAQAAAPAELSKTVEHPKRAAHVKPQAKTVAQAEPQPAPALVPPPAPVAVICRECAVIEDVREVEIAGKASGAGAVGGAVLGGVLGNQVGSGRGRDVATVLGALGGGLAGNQVEKNVNKTKEYRITVRYDDGSHGLFSQTTPPAWKIGDKVKIIDGAIRSSS